MLKNFKQHPNKLSSLNVEFLVLFIYKPGHEKTCLIPYANNKGADQPAHPHSLISASVVRCLDSIISISKFEDSS